MTKLSNLSFESFRDRHLGPRDSDIDEMLELLGYESLDALMDAVVPEDIRTRAPMDLPEGKPEFEALRILREIAGRNRPVKSYLGMGYSDCITPPVILRNIMENPGWYTAYTPYQPEIAQGRLEALLNYQTMVSDLTALEIANASLLDEATAAAEAMSMSVAVTKKKTENPVFLVDERCHPQTIAVVETRAGIRGIEIRVGDPESFEFADNVVGVLVQYPATDGQIRDFSGLADRAHEAECLVTVAADLLSLALIQAPGEWGADIAVGNTQRFGVPLGYGGPHAAYFATKEKYKRSVPGRIIGVSQDRHGKQGLRMALQTREQHIRRDKATSNICTAQVLLAVMAGAYGVYHGPEGLRRIARRVKSLTDRLADAVTRLGYELVHSDYFDTIRVRADSDRITELLEIASERGIEIRRMSDDTVTVALDEATTVQDLQDLIGVFARNEPTEFTVEDLAERGLGNWERDSDFMSHPVFHRYRSETEMLRYLKLLEDRDLSLTSAMIPLGSCTMKLNATTEMIPVTWPEFGSLHPFTAPANARGYRELFDRLERQLSIITGLEGVSLQPNAGSQGEFSGLAVIKAYHESRGEGERDVCIIPKSAHGTNPASAVMAGMKVVTVDTDDHGNIDVDDLRAKAEEHAEKLAALMVTYPSTHGVFEAAIKEICQIIHERGGQVYMDGANLNAQVGLCLPAEIGADVCHINLHKTFCIPHGGGGPGMGPIAVASHLIPFLPDHPVIEVGGEQACGTIAAAPWGSPSILPISWAYIEMMGAQGLLDASRVAILAANYVARRLHGHLELLYSGPDGLIGHECIIDPRPLKAATGVDVEDIAKRLIDYGFHPPTVSFPVPGTLMIEPTESESKEELDRFCDAMIAIREEIREIEEGKADKENNLLKNAPHTLEELTADEWDRPYSRERAAFPSEATRQHKIWPPVGRIDGAWGDRNLMCSCPPLEAYEPAPA